MANIHLMKTSVSIIICNIFSYITNIFYFYNILIKNIGFAYTLGKFQNIRS